MHILEALMEKVQYVEIIIHNYCHQDAHLGNAHGHLFSLN